MSIFTGAGQCRANGTGHSLPNLPLIPPASHRLPTAWHSSASTWELLWDHLGMNHACGPGTRDALGMLRRGPDPTRCPWVSPEPTRGCLAVLPSALSSIYPTRLCLDEAFASWGITGFAGNGAGDCREGDRSECPVGWAGETPRGTRPPSTKPEQEQSTGRNSSCQLWEGAAGCPQAQHGVPKVPPRQVPILAQHCPARVPCWSGCQCGAGWGRMAQDE